MFLIPLLLPGKHFSIDVHIILCISLSLYSSPWQVISCCLFSTAQRAWEFLTAPSGHWVNICAIHDQIISELLNLNSQVNLVIKIGQYFLIQAFFSFLNKKAILERPSTIQTTGSVTIHMCLFTNCSGTFCCKVFSTLFNSA